MYYVTREEWKKIVKSGWAHKSLMDHTHEGKTCKAGKDWMCFESCLPGAPQNGCVLVFEHIHFEII